ncbi:UNVERIFIED_CONTAM: hypothetical protein Sradi_0692300 [Sesamum radiatum]|uniref:Uncharacterized protein n=1 Tax=Sesamum radiatum TaxID=300843 RepID=A0AAW2VN00_SESRA
MMVSILIHGLRKGPLASALARDPPKDVEQLMRVAHKYVDEEEINAMKDEEWQKSRDRGRWKDNKEKYVRAEKERELPYRPKFHRYTPLATTRTKALMMVEKSNLLQWPPQTRFTPTKRFSNKYCRFHREKGHDTEECYQLKDEIEILVRQGYFKEFILEQGGRSRDHKVGERRTRTRSRSRERFKGECRKDGRENMPVKGVINTIAGGSVGGWSNRERKRYERSSREDRRKELVLSVEPEEEITFGTKDLGERRGSQDDPMVIKLDIANFSVHKVLVDNGSSADIVFWDVIKRMGLENAQLNPVHTPLVGFGGSEVASMGTITLPVSIGEEPRRKSLMGGRVNLSPEDKVSHQDWQGEVTCDQKEARRRYNLSLKKGEVSEKPKRKEREDSEGPEQKKFKSKRIEPVEEFKTVELIAHRSKKITRIGSRMSKVVETMMKKRAFGVERNRIIEEEVKKFVRCRICIRSAIYRLASKRGGCTESIRQMAYVHRFCGFEQGMSKGALPIAVNRPVSGLDCRIRAF